MTSNKFSPRRATMICAVGATIAVSLAPLVAFAQSAAPFRIGVLASLTGGVADINNDEVNGLKLRLKQAGYQIAGRKVELVIEDDAGDPSTGVTKIQKLVERDQVDIVVGPFLGHVIAATQDYIGRKGIPNIPLVGQAPESAKQPNMLVPSWNYVQLGRLMGEYAAKKLGYKDAVIVSSKYTFGTRASDGFRDGFTAAGGSVKKEVYVPLGTADFAPFLTGLPQGATVFAAIPGGDAIKFVKARHEYGQRDSMPLVAVVATVDGALLPAMGDAALGAVAVTHYFDDLDIPENKQFIEAYKREYGKVPNSYYSALGFTIGQMIESALVATGGRSDPASLVGALKAVDIKTPQGRLRFDPEKRFPYLDYYFVKVVSKGGKPGYTVLDVLRDVRPD
ncbi:MAG: ABC transporter substrate-binding protein [Burkholderiaceae bacterium]|nr:ABC transporter substrate-binding protein [Burkholderiaceae bacterium]